METDDNMTQDGAVARRSTDTVAATEGRKRQGGQPIKTSTPDGAVARPSTDTVAATEGRKRQGGQPIKTSTPDGAVARPSTDTVAATEGRKRQRGQPIKTSTLDSAVARPSTDTVAATEGRKRRRGQPIKTSTPDGAVARPSTDTVAATEGRKRHGGQSIKTSTPDGAVARPSTDTVAATEGRKRRRGQPIKTSTPDGAVARPSTDTVAATEGRKRQGGQPIKTSTPDGAVARPSTDTVAATEGRKRQGGQPIKTSTPDGAVARPSTDTVAATEGRKRRRGQPIKTSTPDGAVARPSTDTVAATEGRKRRRGQPIKTSTPDGAVARPSTDTVAATEGRKRRRGQPIKTSTPDGAVARPSTDTVAATEGRKRRRGQPIKTSTPDGAVARPSTDTVAATEGRKRRRGQPIKTSTPDGAVARRSTDTVAATEGRKRQRGQPITTSTPDGAVARPSTDTVAATEGRKQQVGQPTTTSTLDGAVARPSTDTEAATEGSQQQGGQPTTTSTPDDAVARPSTDTVAATEGRQQQGGQPTTTSTPDGAVARPSTDTVAATEGRQQQGGQPTTTSTPDGAVARPSTDTVAATEGSQQGAQSISTTTHNYRDCTVSHYDMSNSPGMAVGGSKHQGCISQGCLSVRINQLSDMFVETHALDKAQELLKRHNHVAICGAPGDGKTSAALRICEAYMKKKYQVLFVESIEEFDSDVIIERKCDMLVVFDDVFGSVTFPSSLEKIHRVFNALVDVLLRFARVKELKAKEKQTKKKHDKSMKKEDEKQCEDEKTPVCNYKLRFIFTSRSYNWNEGCARLHQFKVNLFKPEAIVDMIKTCLTSDEKKRIMALFRSQMCDISSKDMKTITQLKDSMFGYPLMCKLYFTNPVFQMHSLVDFFLKPLTYLRGDLDTIVREGSSRSAALVLLVLCGGKLDLVSLMMGTDEKVRDLLHVVKEKVASCTDADISREISNFTGTYCKVENHLASFSHPSIHDAACCALGNLNIVLLVKHCSLQFLYERVRLSKTDSLQTTQTDDVTNMIQITSGLYPLLISRLLGGIRDGCFRWTVGHPVFRNDQLASSLMAELASDLPHIVHQKDKTSGECFLYWVSLSNNDLLFQRSLSLISKNGNLSHESVIDLYDSAIGCVKAGIVRNLQHLVVVLKKHGEFDVDRRMQTNKTQLIIAAEAGHLDVFNFLLQEGANVSMRDREGNNCLHHACQSGNKDIVEVVVEKFPDMTDDPDGLGNTSAMVCVMSGHEEILKVLVSHGADLKGRGYRYLHMACARGHISIVRYLLSYEEININEKTIYEETPVMMAAKAGHSDVYHLLVSEGADLSLTDDEDRDSLMLACEGGDMSIVKHLLSLKTFNINRRDSSGRTPVMMAAKAGHSDVYHLLVSEGADLSFTEYWDKDCLMLACKGGSMSIVKHLLSLKTFNINSRDWFGSTPVMMAAKAGHSDVYHLLVSEGADLSLTDHMHRDSLMLACVGGDMSIVKHLLPLKTFNINRRDRFGCAPFMMAAKARHYDVYHLLVSEGADLSLTDDEDRDCLMLACEGGNMSIVKHLLSLKKFNINRRDRSGRTPVMMAAEARHSDVYHLLVSEGADLSLTDERDRDCLMLACEGGNMSILKHLLSLKKFNISRRDSSGRTPVMMAAEARHSDVYHLLVSEGADLSFTDDMDRDCLLLACMGGNMSFVKHLLSLKTFNINKGDWLGITPVLMAAKAGHSDVYHLLVSEGADLSFTDYMDRDCLMLACEGGNMSIVKHLLSLKKFNINRRDRLNRTPVMMAAEAGHSDVYHLLVSEGADLSLTDEGDRDCLMLACEGGNMSILKHLLSLKKFNINRRDSSGRTPVMMAAEARHSDVYHLLVSEGADLSLTDEGDRDCLMLACERGDMSIVKHLLSLETFNINRRDWWGSTPVMMAAEARHSDVYHLLVSEGADLSFTDDEDRDCLMLACKGGDMSIVKHLLSLKTFNINSRDRSGSTPVMMAAEAGHSGVYHLLVSEGADLSLTDDKDRDCLMFACVGGDMSIVKHLLSLKTFNINRRDRFGSTPVMIATERRHSDVHNLLVSEGADLSGVHK